MARRQVPSAFLAHRCGRGADSVAAAPSAPLSSSQPMAIRIPILFLRFTGRRAEPVTRHGPPAPDPPAHLRASTMKA